VFSVEMASATVPSGHSSVIGSGRRGHDMLRVFGGPNWTAQASRDAVVIRASIDIDTEPDELHDMLHLAGSCAAPGGSIRYHEVYEPGVDCFVVQIDADSPMARYIG
jgi:hypothetical protein